MTDQQLRELIKSSPQTAQRLIFDEYYNYVYTIVFNRLRSCASHEDIDECVSDVFSDIFTKYNINSGYDGDLKGFIAFISKRRAVDLFRRLTSKAAVITSIDDNEAMQLASTESVEELTEKAESGHVLLNAVSALGEPDSTIIMQKYYYERNSSEIADIVGMKPTAVRKRLSRAIDKLRRILTDIDEGR